jgi:hypothetical protein
VVLLVQLRDDDPARAGSEEEVCPSVQSTELATGLYFVFQKVLPKALTVGQLLKCVLVAERRPVAGTHREKFATTVRYESCDISGAIHLADVLGLEVA